MKGTSVPKSSNQSGARILKVLEAVAGQRAEGARALARLLDDDKSAVQRALNTLAAEGWIGRGADGKWNATPRVLALADAAFGGYDLKRRARPILETLRNAFGETVCLVLREDTGFIIADVVEGPAILRVVPPVGAPVDLGRSASGRAMIAALPCLRQAEWLGREPEVALLELYTAIEARGYALSERETDPGAIAIAAAILDADGQPCGAVSVIGPHERLNPDRCAVAGALVTGAARDLSLASCDRSPFLSTV